MGSVLSSVWDASVGAAVGAAEPVADADAVLRKEAVEGIESWAEERPAGGGEEPATAYGAVGSAEDVHAFDECAVGCERVDAGHEVLTRAAEGGEIECGVVDVSGEEAGVALIDAEQHGDLAGAEGTRGVVEDGDGLGSDWRHGVHGFDRIGEMDEA